MNWEDITISILVGAAVLFLFKTLRTPKSNCSDNNCDCGKIWALNT